MLKVIHDEQQLAPLEPALDAVQERPTGGLPHAESPPNQHPHQSRLADAAQIDEAHTVRKRVFGDLGRGDREARFAHATRAGERDQADTRPGQPRDNGLQFVLAANQRGWGKRQVPTLSERGAVDRSHGATALSRGARKTRALMDFCRPHAYPVPSAQAEYTEPTTAAN